MMMMMMMMTNDDDDDNCDEDEDKELKEEPEEDRTWQFYVMRLKWRANQRLHQVQAMQQLSAAGWARIFVWYN